MRRLVATVGVAVLAMCGTAEGRPTPQAVRDQLVHGEAAVGLAIVSGAPNEVFMDLRNARARRAAPGDYRVTLDVAYRQTDQPSQVRDPNGVYDTCVVTITASRKAWRLLVNTCP